MTDTSEWDPTGEVTTELRNAVEIYGERALSSKQLLENFFSDPFPKGNKGANLLVSGAEAGVAASLRRHMDEGLDADNAVMLAGREFEDARPVPAGSGLWVATQMAGVLRIPVSDRLAERATSPQPVAAPVGPAPSPVGPPPQPEPAGYQPQPAGYQPQPAGYQPEPVPPHQPEPPTAQPDPWVWQSNADHQANVGERPTIGVDGTPPPPPLPPVPPPGPSGGNRTLMIVGAVVAVLVIVYLGVAAAAHVAPFSKSSTTTVTSPPTTPVTTPAPTTPTTPAPTTPTTPAPTNPTLAQLMPDQNSSNPLLVATDCQSVSPLPTGLTGVTASDGCSIPGQQGWALFGYQFDNTADYTSSVTTYLSDKGFNAGQADSNCPPASGSQEGQIGWNNQSYPAANGQNLQCLTFQDTSNSSQTDPAYIWELPSRHAIFELIGSSSSTFSQVDSWWTNNGYPSA